MFIEKNLKRIYIHKMNKKGLVQIYYGNGKGKTSLATGIIIRALAYNFKILLIKFFKLKNKSGEDLILDKLNVEIIFSQYMHPYFYYNKLTEELKKKIINNQIELFNIAKEKVKKEYDLIVMDEILDLIKDNIISSDDLIKLIKIKNKNTELILTGHYIDDKLRQVADLISFIKKEKHYYDKKIYNRKGFEY